MKDVVIIGGGIVGLWCAWHLQQAGRQVTIIDKSNFKDGCSFGNAGMIVPSHFIPMASPGIIATGIRWMFKKDSPFYIRPRLNLELAQWLFLFYKSASRKHVDESVCLLRDMHEESRELYRHVNQIPGFQFDFQQRGILMLYKSQGAEKDEMETAEKAHELGIKANQLTPDQLKQIEPGIDLSVKGAIHYPGDAHLIPQVFMQQMKGFLEQSGVEFIHDSEVVDIDEQGSSGAYVSILNKEKLHARNVVVTAGSWSGKLMRKSGFRLPMQDGKGYSMTISNPPFKPSIPSILHEARVAITPMGSDLRISGTLEISGMDDRVNQHKVDSILRAVPDYYPQLKVNDPGPVWYGYRPCTPDGLPYIGRWKEGSSVIIATGHAMMGLSLAPVTGRMTADILTGKETSNPSSKLNPSRFS